MILESILKIFDFLPSKNTFKILLTVTVVVFAAAYWFGKTINVYENDMNNINLNTEKNTVLINKIVNKISDLEKGRSADFNIIYQDMVEINTRNNFYWNNKFNILLKYGTTNEELSRDLMDIEESKQQIEDANFLKSKEYLNKNNTDTIK